MTKPFLGDGLSAEDSYKAKRDYLDSRFGDALDPMDFYRELYPSGSFEQPHQRGYDYAKESASERRPNGIITEILAEPDGARKTKRWVVNNDLQPLRDMQGTDRFGLMAPIGYSGVKRDLKHAYTIYALTFDLDEPNIPLFFDNAKAEAQPQPTFTVLSGHGLHLYYQFEEPQPLYPHNIKAFQALKRALTMQIWNPNTSHIQPQHQGINQGFRIVGAASKLGKDYPVRVWRTGQPKTVDYLPEFIFNKKAHSEALSLFERPRMNWEEAKERYPEWAARKTGKAKQSYWHIKRDLYDWWKHQYTAASNGHRYFYLMCLAVYARKCDIPREELEHDARQIAEYLDSLSPADGTNPFTQEDMKAALKAYDDKYQTFTRDAISHLAAIPIIPNRRNGRKQKEHLARARAVQTVDDPLGAWRNKNGRPIGSGTKEKTVRDYIALHPDQSVTEIAKALNVSRPTVYKYRN